MNIYIILSDNVILKAYKEKQEAESYIINYIKSNYNINENNIYIDKYDEFTLYNFKYNNSYLTYKIIKTTLN